jgi:hypothetical protein
MPAILVGIVLVALAATALDWIWYTLGVRHGVIAGVIHGAALLTVAGGVLGAATGRALRGLPIGTLAGIGGALAYYAYAALIDERSYGPAIGVAWTTTWLVLALLEGRFVRRASPRPWSEVALRGVAAAVLSGVAFYLVMDTLWGEPPPSGRSYAVQLVCWAFAWAPGLLALSAERRSRGR